MEKSDEAIKMNGYYNSRSFLCFRFYLVFEKVNGGPLLTRIQEHIHFTEREASQIIRDLASALQFLHVKGEFMFV
jgi:serine/threonine protein kinase